MPHMALLFLLGLAPSTFGASEDPVSEDSDGFLVHEISSPYQAGTTRVRVLLPDRRPPGRRFPVLYILPVEAGDGTRWGDGLLEARKADLANRHEVICVAPTFSHLPWYADHPSDPRIRQESYFVEDVVPLVERIYPVRTGPGGRLLLGFSKSGWGAWSLLLRRPDLFGRAAAWDAPLAQTRPDAFGMGEIFGTQERFDEWEILGLLERRADDLKDATRLALLGYGTFRDHHQRVHARMRELGIPHAYRDGPEREHRWSGDWMEEGAALVTSKGPVRVLLLAGQSNMEGQAVVDLDHEEYYNGGRGTLEHVLRDPEKAPRWRHLRKGDGAWRVRDDVRVWYRPERGELKSGRLSVGYAVYPGRHHFGPELQLGWVLGDALEEPVLLVKTAWGGKSLQRDFRPPRSGGAVGPCYTKMLEELRDALATLDSHFPESTGRGYELAGLVWFQGWNDMIDAEATAEYERNLTNLILDTRSELGTPHLPIVIAETGHCGNEDLRRAQAAVARRPELGGTVAFVPTREFLRRPEDSPNVGHGHHWFGNAESFLLIGDAMGKALLALLEKGDVSPAGAPIGR